MVPATHVGAHWALFSKHPGVTMEYAILAASFTAGDAMGYVRAGLTGHPESEATGQPEQLPWLVFLGGTADAPAFAVMAMTWSQERDGTRQPIAPSRLLLVDWEDAAHAQLTFEGAARTLFGLGWDAVTTGPPGVDTGQVVELDLPSDVDLAATAARIDDLGFDWVAGAAAALLDGGQVVILADGDFPTVVKRLAILDAVCALLPYGYRAQLSAATWAGHRIEHSVRLTFAGRHREGQSATWLGGAAAAPRTPAAQSYLRQLLNLRHHKGIITSRLVAHLAGQRLAAGSRSPSEVIDRLLDVDLPSAVYESIVEGRGRVDQLARVLDGGGWDAFEEGQRPDCIRFLGQSTLSSDPATGALGQRLLSSHFSAEVAQTLSEDAVRGFASGSADAARRWISVLEPAPAQMLLVATAVAVANQPTAASAFADLLWNPAAGTSPWAPTVQLALLARPAAATQLLAAAAATGLERGDRLSTVVSNWRTVLPEAEQTWLRPFMAAVDPLSHPVSPSDVDTLRRLWPDAIILVFRAAIEHGRLDSLPVAVWDELVRFAVEALDQNDDAGIDAAARLLDRAAAGPVRQEDAARLDILRLAISAAMPFVEATGYQPSPAYEVAFQAQWSDPRLDPLRPLLVRHAVRSLRAGPVGLVYLMRLADHLDPALSERTTAALQQYLEANPYEWALAAGAWAQRVDGWVKWMHVLDQRCQARADPSEIAEAGVLALRWGADPAIVELPTRTWHARTSDWALGNLLVYLPRYYGGQSEAPARAFYEHVLVRIERGEWAAPALSYELADRIKQSDELYQRLQRTPSPETRPPPGPVDTGTRPGPVKRAWHRLTGRPVTKMATDAAARPSTADPKAIGAAKPSTKAAKRRAARDRQLAKAEQKKADVARKRAEAGRKKTEAGRKKTEAKQQSPNAAVPEVRKPR